MRNREDPCGRDPESAKYRIVCLDVRKGMSLPEVDRAQPVSLNAEEAKINSWVFNIC